MRDWSRCSKKFVDLTCSHHVQSLVYRREPCGIAQSLINENALQPAFFVIICC